MILVDIFIPEVDKEYDFQLDGNASISTLIEEIGEMVGQKEHSSVVGEIKNLLLCDRKTGTILPQDATLSFCGIENGGRLILV